MLISALCCCVWARLGASCSDFSPVSCMGIVLPFSFTSSSLLSPLSFLCLRYRFYLPWPSSIITECTVKLNRGTVAPQHAPRLAGVYQSERPLAGSGVGGIPRVGGWREPRNEGGEGLVGHSYGWSDRIPSIQAFLIPHEESSPTGINIQYEGIPVSPTVCKENQQKTNRGKKYIYITSVQLLTSKWTEAFLEKWMKSRRLQRQGRV